MKTSFKFLVLVILVTFSSCDKSKKIDYKYTDSPNLLACNFTNSDLYKEAVYAFENDIINTYDNKNKKVVKAYSSFINFRLRGTIKVKEIASEHSLNIAKALKKEANLWVTTNGTTRLNSAHPIGDCIANNIIDKNIKTTYNSLLTTNSLKPNLILPLLSSSARYIQADGNLKSYVALELFYSQLLDVKLEELKNPNPKQQPEPAKPLLNNIDLNATPKEIAPKQITPTKLEAKEDLHAGHNHD